MTIGGGMDPRNQPPAEAHCATCACVPGMTPAVRFDTTPAEREGAVRDHLIRMGWTPPAEARAERAKICYQCAARVTWLADDSRCSRCTRLTPDEIIGGS